ncbi:MAG TPA: LuxR C-terminal-related transcriptional regulator [Streptomyces sp.]|nr:LuxR C-terminal-related transcriptional regulator [Streptomyces sp.]
MTTTPRLSDRQQTILHLRATGHTGPQIAAQLHIAPSTVDYHERVILHTLRAHTWPHAILLACQAGILDGRPRRHGDHAGYNAHLYRGENPRDCLPCWEGERAYRAEQRAARRARKTTGAHAA